MPVRGRFVAFGCFLIVAGFCGLACNKTEGLNPVQGKVRYQGKPLAGALVSFHPSGGMRDPSTGMTKEDGTFSLVTGEINGAVAGKYTVTIMCQVPTKAQPTGTSFGGMPETEDMLKGAYSNKSSSKITVDVKDGPNQLEPFELQ